MSPKSETQSNVKVVKGRCSSNSPTKCAEVKDLTGSIVRQVMTNLTPGGKAKIRIEIEVSKD